jgi:hypothetical protein
LNQVDAAADIHSIRLRGGANDAMGTTKTENLALKPRAEEDALN